MTQNDAVLLEGVCYLNNAGQAPLAPEVTAAGVEAVQRLPWEKPSSDDRSAVRALYASLIRADAKDIAIMPCTAYAITMAARNVQRTLIEGTGATGKILLLQDQMNSAVYGWQQICAEYENDKVRLEIIPYPTNDSGWTEAVLNHLDDNVLVACLPPLHWSDGALLDLRVIGEACRRHKIMLVVDATQAIGIMPFSVQDVQPAMVACTVHKWLRGPSGMSLVYISQQLHSSWEPLDQHGRSRLVELDDVVAWDAAMNRLGPRGYPAEFCSDARKFDSGGKPNAILFPMVRASLEKVVQIPVEQAQEQLRALMEPIVEWAKDRGFSFTPGPHAWHLIGIRPNTRQMSPERMVEIATALQRDGIYIAVRCGAFRISPYLDTQPADIQTLLNGLDRYCS